MSALPSSSGTSLAQQADAAATRPLPPYFPSTTSRPAQLPKAYLNGTQDMLSLFGLMPIYDRAVRPYNPEMLKAAAEASAAAASSSSTSAIGVKNEGSNANASGADGQVSSQLQSSSSTGGGIGATPRGGSGLLGGIGGGGLVGGGSGPATVTAGIGTLQSQAPSSGRTSTPALQLNGGPPSFSLPTDSSALLGASPGQVAAVAAAAPPAKKPTKPPATYAHYVQDLAGRVRPPRKASRGVGVAAPTTKMDKGPTLMNILNKPEYTPQHITPFDRDTINSAFKVQSGEVAEIDQALLEPDDEEQPRKKKKKKNRDRDRDGLATAVPNTTTASTARR